MSKSAKGITLALTGMIKSSIEGSAARTSLTKLFIKVSETFKFNYYKNMDYLTKDYDYSDICSAMKLETSVCNVTLETFGRLRFLMFNPSIFCDSHNIFRI